MNTSEVKNITKVPIIIADDLIKIVRLTAMIGRKVFVKYLFDPLDYASWKRRPTNEVSKKLMERIDLAARDETAQHTIGPLSKRMVSASMNESLSALGDASIFLLEKVQQFAFIATLKESIEFVQIIYPDLQKFMEHHQSQSADIFAEGLKDLSADDFKKAFKPIDLGKHKIKIEMQRQALDLFHKIKIANKNDDIERCRKMIGAYLIKYGDQENNNREEVDHLIDAFQVRDINFKTNLEANIAVNLYYGIQTSIASGNLKQTIQGIKKYAHIFQGNPDIKFYFEIDALEQRLYDMITAKNLWAELKESTA